MTFITTDDGFERVRLGFDDDDDVLVQLVDSSLVTCLWSPRHYDDKAADELARDCVEFWVEQRCR